MKGFNSGFFIAQQTINTNMYMMSLDGVNEYIHIPDDSTINFNYTDAISQTVWVNLIDYSIASYKWIYSKRDFNYKGYSLAFNSGNLHLFLISSLGALIEIRTDGVTFVNNQTYHIGFTYNGNTTATGVKIYVDGVQVSTVTVVNGTLTTSLSNTSPLYISNDTNLAGYIAGQVGIIRFWNVELNASQILEDYNGGVMRNIAILPNNLVFGWKAGQDALYGNQWVFPIELNNAYNPTAYSINIEFADRILIP